MDIWEGSFRYEGRGGVSAENPRSDPAMTYPVAEYVHGDPTLIGRAAATGVVVYRRSDIPQLQNQALFGDFPSGEIFHFDADDPPARVGTRDSVGCCSWTGGVGKTFLQIVQEKNAEQGRDEAGRTDLRMDQAGDGRVFLLNEADGTIRVLTSG